VHAASPRLIAAHGVFEEFALALIQGLEVVLLNQPFCGGVHRSPDYESYPSAVELLHQVCVVEASVQYREAYFY